MSLISITSKQEFYNTISENKVALMVYKQGCSYCDKAMPWMRELSLELGDRIVAIMSQNVSGDLVDTLGVKVFPTFILLEDGVVSDMFYGDTKEEKVKAFMSKDFETSIEDIETQNSLDEMEEW